MKNWARSVKESWGESPVPPKLEKVKLNATKTHTAFKGENDLQGVRLKESTKAPKESYTTLLVNVAPEDRGHLIGTAGVRIKALQLYYGVHIKVFREPSELVRVRGPESKVREAVDAIDNMFVVPRKQRMALEEEWEQELNSARQRMGGELKQIKMGYDIQKSWLAGEIQWMRNRLIG